MLPLRLLGKGNQIMTAILMAMVPVVVAFLAAQKYIVQGMVAGSIK